MHAVEAGGIGVEIRGIDLGQPLTDTQQTQLRQMYAEHGLLFFHDQQLTPERHVEVAGVFGDIVVNRFFTPVDGFPKHIADAVAD